MAFKWAWASKTSLSLWKRKKKTHKRWILKRRALYLEHYFFASASLSCAFVCFVFNMPIYCFVCTLSHTHYTHTQPPIKHPTQWTNERTNERNGANQDQGKEEELWLFVCESLKWRTFNIVLKYSSIWQLALGQSTNNRHRHIFCLISIILP